VRVIAFAMLVALSAAGCAMRRPPPAAAPVMVQPTGSAEQADAQIVWQDYGQLVDLDGQIEELSARGDCGAACEAGAQMCQLSERICEISARQPGDAEVSERCADGRGRCERARERLAMACSCPSYDPGLE
jgi:hypothetical protein